MTAVEEVKQCTADVLKRHNVEEAYLFGSLVRGELREDSDIDMLVRFKKLNGLFTHVRIKHDLEDALGGRKVDLVQMEAVRPEYRERIDAQKVRII